LPLLMTCPLSAVSK
jgi:hypothetical protein